MIESGIEYQENNGNSSDNSNLSFSSANANSSSSLWDFNPSSFSSVISFEDDQLIQSDLSDVYQDERIINTSFDEADNPVEGQSSPSVDDIQQFRFGLKRKFEDEQESEEDREKLANIKKLKDSEIISTTFADSEKTLEESNDSNDVFLTHRNKIKPKGMCRKCKETCNWAFSLCLRCFKEKKNWLPQRTKRKSKKKEDVSKPKPNSDNFLILDNHNKLSTSTTTMNENSSNIKETEIVSSSQCSQEIGYFPQSQGQMSIDGQNLESGSSQNHQDTCSSQQTFVKSELEDSQNLQEDHCCQMCFNNKIDGAFIHLNQKKIAHCYSCYYCSIKILKSSGKCPMCREKILNVVRLVY